MTQVAPITTGMPAVDRLLASEQARLEANGIPAGVARQAVASALGRVRWHVLSLDIRERATLQLLAFELRGTDAWCERWLAAKDTIVPRWRESLTRNGTAPGPASAAALEAAINARASQDG
jgi:threonine synthase